MLLKNVLLPVLVVLSLKTAAQLPLLVTDLNPGAASASPFNLVVFKDRLCFAATTPGKGFELWRYDGSSPAQMVPEINAGPGDGVPLLSFAPPVELAGKLYFGATNAGGAGVELFVYNGTGVPTLAADINPGTAGSLPAGLTLFNNKIFFAAASAAGGFELYSFNGGGQPQLYDVYPGASSSMPADLTVFNGKLYFSAATPATGAELFVYDTATDAVTLAADVAPGAVGSSIAGMAALGNDLYFTALTGAEGRELWRYDGVSATLVNDLRPGPGSGQAPGGWLVAYDGNLYFSGTTDGTSFRLYRYEPVSGNTVEAAVINPAGNIAFSWPYVFNGKLYFAAGNGTSGTELWEYDGTAATQVGDINPGSGNSEPMWPTAFGGRLYFSAFNDATGRELYRLQVAGGIQHVAFDGSAGVAPNPAQGDAVLLLSLKGAQRCSFDLTDVSGKTVWRQGEALYESGDHRIQLPSGRLVPGVYFYGVRSGGRLLVSGRMVKR